MKKSSKTRLFYLGILVASLLLAVALMLFFPVRVTVLNNEPDENMTPYGAIKSTSPLDLCMPSYVILEGYRDIGFDLMLATFDRENSSRYSFKVYGLEKGKKSIFTETEFSSAGLTDNSYKSFPLSSQNAGTSKLCFSLASSEATDKDSITIWMNGQSEPVIKIAATTNVANMIRLAAQRNAFPLGETAVLGLFLIYLVSQFWLIGYLLITRPDAEKEISKSAHHQRADRRRV